jgi:hypothetical protein
LTDASGAGAKFGASVALSDGMLIVGEPELTVAGFANRGSATFYSWSGSQFGVASIASGNPHVGEPIANGFFGASAAIRHGVALIGAPGGLPVDGYAYGNTAYVRVLWGRPATQTFDYWADPKIDWTPTGFGASVAVGGKDGSAVAVIGAPATAVGTLANAGAAYFLTPVPYTNAGGLQWTWGPGPGLLANGIAAGDAFGASVGVDVSTSGATTAIVGAPGAQNGTGAAYVYGLSGSTWTKTSTLSAFDAAVGDRFGASSAIRGASMLVGAPHKGTAYFFQN